MLGTCLRGSHHHQHVQRLLWQRFCVEVDFDDLSRSLEQRTQLTMPGRSRESDACTTRRQQVVELCLQQLRQVLGALRIKVRQHRCTTSSNR